MGHSALWNNDNKKYSNTISRNCNWEPACIYVLPGPQVNVTYVCDFSQDIQSFGHQTIYYHKKFYHCYKDKGRKGKTLI